MKPKNFVAAVEDAVMQAAPLPVVEGTPREIGESLGRYGAPAASSLTASTVWRSLQARRGDAQLQEWITRVRDVFPDYWEELCGMARGMGVDPDALFLWNCRADLIAQPAHSCCTVAVNRLGSRFVIHAQQHGPAMHEQARPVEIRPRDRPGFVCMHWPGSLPGFGAVATRAGLVQAALSVHGGPACAGLPTAFVARAVLDADSLASALDIVMQCERGGRAHHLLASSLEFIMAAVEAGPGERLLQPISNKLLYRREAGPEQDQGFARLQSLYEGLPHHPGREDMLALWDQYTLVRPGTQIHAAFLAIGNGSIDIRLHCAGGRYAPLRMAARYCAPVLRPDARGPAE